MEQPSEKALRLAKGKWAYIYQALAPELEDAIIAAKSGTTRHVSCPVHGGEEGDAFRLFKDWKQNGGGICNTCGGYRDGIRILAWLKNEPYGELLKRLFDLLEDGNIIIPTQMPSREEQAQARAERDARSVQAANAIRRVWSQALPVSDPRSEIARLYFAGRGLEMYANPDVVRFHPALFYRDKQVERAFLPALVFRVVDAHGRAVTLHRIYLDPAGRKANVATPKRLMPYPRSWRVLSGGAIRLFPLAREMGIAEGPETALAVYMVTGMPMWSTISAELMESIYMPEYVERLWVWQDKDVSGRGGVAAQAACDMMWNESREAGAWVPRLAFDEGQKSVDWLDVLNRVGVSGFPKPALAEAQWRIAR